MKFEQGRTRTKSRVFKLSVADSGRDVQTKRLIWSAHRNESRLAFVPLPSQLTKNARDVASDGYSGLFGSLHHSLESFQGLFDRAVYILSGKCLRSGAKDGDFIGARRNRSLEALRLRS